MSDYRYVLYVENEERALRDLYGPFGSYEEAEDLAKRYEQVCEPGEYTTRIESVSPPKFLESEIERMAADEAPDLA